MVRLKVYKIPLTRPPQRLVEEPSRSFEMVILVLSLLVVLMDVREKSR